MRCGSHWLKASCGQQVSFPVLSSCCPGMIIFHITIIDKVILIYITLLALREQNSVSRSTDVSVKLFKLHTAL